MMKIKFNHYERIAGLFVLGCLFALLVALVGVAIKQGWFDSRVYYTTTFINGDGLHSGTLVQMAGLRAGNVEDVELTSDNQVRIRFSVLSKFQSRVRTDSVASLVRPFIIGDRIVDISLGSESEPILEPGSMMRSRESLDLMTILSGRRMGDYVETMSTMMDSLKIVAEGLLNKDRSHSFLKVLDQVEPLVENVNTMAIEMIQLSRQATGDKNLKKVMAGLSVTTREINQVLPHVREVMPLVQALIPVVKERAPELGRNLEQLVGNLALMTEQFKVVLPALAEIAPELPRSSRRAVEALDEAVVLLKAMQKTWVLSGSTEEVREEEAKRDAAQRDRQRLRRDARETSQPVLTEIPSDLIEEVPPPETDTERTPASE